jgi:hypothetical protein
MSVKLPQREPGPAAIAKGLESLINGLNARNPGQRWRVSSPPDRLKGAGPVGTGHVDRPRIVGPDHKGAIGDGGSPGPAANEDALNHPREEVA